MFKIAHFKNQCFLVAYGAGSDWLILPFGGLNFSNSGRELRDSILSVCRVSPHFSVFFEAFSGKKFCFGGWVFLNHARRMFFFKGN